MAATVVMVLLERSVPLVQRVTRATPAARVHPALLVSVARKETKVTQVLKALVALTVLRVPAAKLAPMARTVYR
jgi:hypothetical protein